MTSTLDRLGAALAGRYTLLGELGHGGMATVYLADDLKHHRREAIKVLRPELGSLLGPDRFAREVRTAAGLNHPHILPLYDSGEAGGSSITSGPTCRADRCGSGSPAACSKDLPTGPAERAGGDAASSVQALSAPANDDFDNAIVIAKPPFTNGANTSDATTADDDPVPSCADGGQGPTVWYAFTPSHRKRTEANTFGSDYDTDLVVYTGTRGDLTEIACYDDAGNSVQFKVIFNAAAGETSYIMVGAWASGPGGRATFRALMRWIYDGVDASLVVDKVGLK